VDPRVLILLPALGLVAVSANPLVVPGRDGSPSGALIEGLHQGNLDVPWTVSAELDGQAEEWVPWVGLPLRENAAPLQGGEDLMARVGGGGPQGVSTISREPRAGFGGIDEYLLMAQPLASDTPITSLQFFRGAVNSYRFGFGLSRNVLGPWDFDMRMNTRSAPGRYWAYRQQVNDMFGPRGQPAGLPYHGQGPGQDDVRWETVASRKLDGGRLDFGWDWIDEQRGVPDPLSTWDSLLPKFDAYSSRGSLFSRLELEKGAWSLQAGARQESHDWSLPSWTDTGLWANATGTETVDAGNVRLGIGPTDRRFFLEGLYESRDGTAMVVRDTGLFDGGLQETRLRAGFSGIWRLDALEMNAGAGWNSLDAVDGQNLSGMDAQANARWGTDRTWLRGGWARSVVLPGFDQTLRPDAYRPRLDTLGLQPETRDRLETRGTMDFGPVSAELGMALLFVSNALRPEVIPWRDAETQVADRESVLRLRNRTEIVQGYSTEAALHGAWRWFDGTTRFGFGRMGLPGQPLFGDVDYSEPQMRSRTSVRWSAELLPGRFRATTTLGLSTWSGSWIYVPSNHSGATMVELPSSWNLDLENRCEIQTFEIFWRIENIGDKRQEVLPGWSPLGIRAGWGIVWSFGG